MASRIAGITVEIGGDTTKLSKALESVNKTIKTTQSELKDVNKLLKLDPSNTEAVTQKQRMLKEAIEATKEKLTTFYERIPLARLGIVTPTPWVGSMPSKTTCGMAKYSEAIVEICKRRSIPCLDLYHESNLRPDDENFRKLAFSKDGGNGVHPDEKGHEIIAASFQSLLERLIL